MSSFFLPLPVSGNRRRGEEWAEYYLGVVGNLRFPLDNTYHGCPLFPAETFFDRPLTLQRHAPDLYGILSTYYRQDPAGRVNRTCPVEK